MRSGTLHASAADPQVVPAARSMFRALVGEGQWQALPRAVQLRFDGALAPGEEVVYVGEVACTQRTRIGRLWALLLRFAGSPLPLESLHHTASTVVVTGTRTGAQCWTRTYESPGRRSQVIRSMKCFSGPTGLEERVGAGLSMALTVSVESRALVFRSVGYHWKVGAWTLSIPMWLTPGAITVRHREERSGRFSFTLSVVHPLFGCLIHQVAYFRDAHGCAP